MRLVVGISGASGVIYGIRALEVARDRGIETHLVISKYGQATISLETDYSVSAVKALAHRVYSPDDLAAAIASGSFPTDGMMVCPCSINTASAIAYGLSDNLLVRAADVTLKEKRKLVVVVRETPLHVGHLRTLTALAEMGAVILPPMPAFYLKPSTVEEIVMHTVARVFAQFGVDVPGAPKWEGP